MPKSRRARYTLEFKIEAVRPVRGGQMSRASRIAPGTVQTPGLGT
jgi:transposase-like protein